MYCWKPFPNDGSINQATIACLLAFCTLPLLRLLAFSQASFAIWFLFIAVLNLPLTFCHSSWDKSGSSSASEASSLFFSLQSSIFSSNDSFLLLAPLSLFLPLFPASFFTFIDFIEELGKTFIDFIGEDGVFWDFIGKDGVFWVVFIALTAFIEVCDAFILVFKTFMAALLAMSAKKPKQRTESHWHLKVRLQLQLHIFNFTDYIQNACNCMENQTMAGIVQTMTAKSCIKKPQWLKSHVATDNHNDWKVMWQITMTEKSCGKDWEVQNSEEANHEWISQLCQSMTLQWVAACIRSVMETVYNHSQQ